MDWVPCHILHPARVHQAVLIHQCPHQYLPLGHVVVVVCDGEDLQIAAAAEVQAVVVLVVLGAILVGGAVTPEELEDFRTDKGHYRTPEAPQLGAIRTPEVVLLGLRPRYWLNRGILRWNWHSWRGRKWYRRNLLRVWLSNWCWWVLR